MLKLPFQYLRWHYGPALRSYGRLAHDYLWYLEHIFSIRFLLRTLLLPWKRRNEQYFGGGIEKYFEAVVVSFLSRVVGVVIKLPIIVVGCVSWLCLLLVLLLGFGLWLMAPVLLLGMIIGGSYMLYV